MEQQRRSAQRTGEVAAGLPSQLAAQPTGRGEFPNPCYEIKPGFLLSSEKIRKKFVYNTSLKAFELQSWLKRVAIQLASQ
jgi:hypothetical protein